MARKAKNSTEVLKAAKWMLENVGWSQRANFRNKRGDIIGSSVGDVLPANEYSNLGSVCLNGAIQLVETTEQLRLEALQRLNKAVPKEFNGAIGFNDHNGTTKNQVLSLVRRAIKESNK